MIIEIAEAVATEIDNNGHIYTRWIVWLAVAFAIGFGLGAYLY